MSSNSLTTVALKKVWLSIGAMIAALLLSVFGILYIDKLGDKHDYARYTAPREADLVHARGRITRISNHVPYLEIQLDDGRDLLATFLIFRVVAGTTSMCRTPAPSIGHNWLHS
jgi:membrane protein YdbS with pleckstrin-like domain